MMDASALPQKDAALVLNLLNMIDGQQFPVVQQKNPVIKYTKLPDFDFNTKVSWPAQTSYTLQPRLRRIIAFDDDNLLFPKALASKSSPDPTLRDFYRKVTKLDQDAPSVPSKTSGFLKSSCEEIITDVKSDLDYRPIVSRSSRPTKKSNSSKQKVYSVNILDKTTQNCENSVRNIKKRIVPPLSALSTRENKSSAKTPCPPRKKSSNVYQSNNKSNRATHTSPESYKLKQQKEKDLSIRAPRSANTYPTRSTKIFIASNDNERALLHRSHKVSHKNPRSVSPYRPKYTDGPSSTRVPLSNRQPKNISASSIRSTKSHRPKSPKSGKKKQTISEQSKQNDNNYTPPTLTVSNNYCYTDDIVMLKHVNVGTEHHISIDQVTDTDDFYSDDYKCDNSVQTELVREMFDSLEIPNVTLTKDKAEVIKDNVKSCSSLLPNVKLTSCERPSNRDDINMCASASFVYSSATLTYTTRKHVNFNVVDGEDIKTNVAPNPLSYPLNVVSVFKQEMENNIGKVTNDVSTNTILSREANKPRGDRLNDQNSTDYSYIINKIFNPSDLISSVRVNDGQLHNEYLCEQFQRELNFIDSFLSSLQYLENCSLSAKCIPECRSDNLLKSCSVFDAAFDVKSSECDNFLSKFEKSENIEDSETMASKSLCLLNLLIRDEQRRAKNLLFVLKMREDALKDFTKSQILWLEKKKKQDNTDISTLKKKQRGALLKLQHECGEMQRMRKALITLSERRKVALMKTKKNIELKLDNNVDVEHIILGKKKVKRTATLDRNPSPLKCFDLSSSGCEETTSKIYNEMACVPPTTATPVPDEEKCVAVTSPEKNTHTDDGSQNHTISKLDSDVRAENLVAVDGRYLNIIFNDLALPQIFSSGKEYEVNEKELQSIVGSTNSSFTNNQVIEKNIDAIVTNKELDSSTPSTARSLVDEFDQYYKGLTEIEKNTSEDMDLNESSNLTEKQLLEINLTAKSVEMIPAGEVSSSASEYMVSEATPSVESEEAGALHQITGPLPVPVGANAVVNNPPSDVASSSSLQPKSSASEKENNATTHAPNSNVELITTPVQSEAEELRRQQLAIEREIKALEQQQCRMLVVREIPDKPPPPYTPPIETKPKPPMFVVDDCTQLKIETYIKEMYCSTSIIDSSQNLSTPNYNDAFDTFTRDFCKESVESHKQEDSDKPWDAINLLPQKRQSDLTSVIKNIFEKLCDSLRSPKVRYVSVVSGRRSDHIDDILFNEWRLCESEWTTLHSDEALVKNQLFEIIFQRILSETVQEYKKVVQGS